MSWPEPDGNWLGDGDKWRPDDPLDAMGNGVKRTGKGNWSDAALDSSGDLSEAGVETTLGLLCWTDVSVDNSVNRMF